MSTTSDRRTVRLGTGTGNGHTEHAKRVECPEAWHLWQEMETERDEHEYPTGRTVGSILHAYTDLWLSEGFQGTIDFVDSEGAPHDFPIEVEKRYRNTLPQVYDLLPRYPNGSTYLGQIVSTEQHAQFKFPPDVDTIRTTQIDVISDIDQHTADMINEEHGTALFPGRYVIDHKFEASMPADLGTAKAFQTQWPFLFLAAEALYGQGSIAGVLCNLITTAKTAKHGIALIPPPNMNELAMLERFCLLADSVSAGERWCNLAACQRFYSWCDHLVMGRCDRAGPMPGAGRKDT